MRPGLGGMFYQSMEQVSPDLRARLNVRLVVPLRRPKMAEAINAALGVLPKKRTRGGTEGPYVSGLASCLVYVSWRGILVRPFVPPTSENEAFSGATQRVYLSATLGRAGELERSFGRAKIARLPLPNDRSPRSGRRYFIFGDLAEGDPQELAVQVTAAAGKALVLATSTDHALKSADALNVSSWPVLGKDDVEKDLGAFRDQEHAILALAGRYDGIDLPDDACRLVCFEGLPDSTHLQEQFLGANLRAKSALEERTRTRVVQGAGRATRNPSDHAIVLVRGGDLTRYLASPVVRQALDLDFQAEVAFGLENSREFTHEDVLENVRIFLEQGDDWRTNAEPHIAEARRNAKRIEPIGSVQLAKSAPYEVEAGHCAFRGDFVGAREAAQKAAIALSGEEDVRSYRALWLYLAAVWSFSASDASAAKTAVGLLQQAHKAALGKTWLRETEAGAESAAVEEDVDDTPGVREIVRRLENGIKPAKVNDAIERMKTGLAEATHTKFEPALTELGLLLGADAEKPSGQGRCDSSWCWESRVWIAIEAKSEEDPDEPVPLRDVRQANTQPSQVATDRGVGLPALAASVIACPRTQVVDEAVTQAEAHVFLTHPDEFIALGDDIARCWEKLLLTHHGNTAKDLEALVRRTMAEHQVLPTQAYERLTGIPIHS